MSPAFPKRIVKRLVRPIARPVLRRVDARFEPLRADLAAITDHLPALLNTIASQNAVARESRRAEIRLAGEINDLREQVEVVRSEVLAEIARIQGTTEPTGGVKARVLAPERLAAMATGNLNLNLGCGDRPLAGFVNIDVRPLEGVDVVADVTGLPFDPGTVAHIHSVHLLERYAPDDLAQLLLPYWLSLLQPEGRLSAVITDIEGIIGRFGAGDLSFDELHSALLGSLSGDCGGRRSMFSRESICKLLERAGFVQVRVVDTQGRAGPADELEVECRRPAMAEPSGIEASRLAPSQ